MALSYDWRLADILNRHFAKSQPCLRVALFDAADGGAIFLAGGSGAVIAQYCGGAIGGLLFGCADKDYGSALLDVIGVKLLVADVVGLVAGQIARFALFERAAGAE
jgi:hypothetical protein